ncbi:hypothetical protein KCG44_05080 [Pacificimonas sp. WHA3]|uniref:Uncharacterized protein n=1 Tax=Pacificimonas pallii TaxID=2827236 RepID=A0ABS6SCK9_9SPHN|nr:hypothetical protein [Pacificimonas pallii]MBV7256154.1 hypothetical protein [Pacificimonas pallii]
MTMPLSFAGAVKAGRTHLPAAQIRRREMVSMKRLMIQLPPPTDGGV